MQRYYMLFLLRLLNSTLLILTLLIITSLILIMRQLIVMNTQYLISLKCLLFPIIQILTHTRYDSLNIILNLGPIFYFLSGMIVFALFLLVIKLLGSLCEPFNKLHGRLASWFYYGFILRFIIEAYL